MKIVTLSVEVRVCYCCWFVFVYLNFLILFLFLFLFLLLLDIILYSHRHSVEWINNCNYWEKKRNKRTNEIKKEQNICIYWLQQIVFRFVSNACCWICLSSRSEYRVHNNWISQFFNIFSLSLLFYTFQISVTTLLMYMCISLTILFTLLACFVCLIFQLVRFYFVFVFCIFVPISARFVYICGMITRRWWCAYNSILYEAMPNIDWIYNGALKQPKASPFPIIFLLLEL